MNTSPDCAFTFKSIWFNLGHFLHSSEIVSIPHVTVQGARLNEGWTEGARGEISCAEEANAQLPGRSRVRTFARTLSTVGRLLAIAPEKADKIDWDMSMSFELTPSYTTFRIVQLLWNRTNSTCLLLDCFVQWIIVISCPSNSWMRPADDAYSARVRGQFSSVGTKLKREWVTARSNKETSAFRNHRMKSTGLFALAEERCLRW